jgi:hypothetical protein
MATRFDGYDYELTEENGGSGGHGPALLSTEANDR